jgi:hypothetical protein
MSNDLVITGPADIGDAAFGAGLRALRFEHRSTDYAGRPVDPSAETETQRTERIRALQDRWVERQPPATDPAGVLREWMAQSAEHRMSRFAQRLAEDPTLMPEAESEPHPGQAPIPGGLIERLAAQRAAKHASATLRQVR